MKYKLKKIAVVPYKMIKALKSQLIDLLDQQLTNESMFYLIGSNLGWVRVLLLANYEDLKPEDVDDLDIIEDIVPMCKEIIEKIKEDIKEKSDKYILHEYNEDFTEPIGTHLSVKYKVSLGIVEDVISAIMGIQETKTISAEDIDNILEDAEETILKGFPSLDCIRIENLNAIEIIKVYRKYFDLGIALLTKKKGHQPQRNQSR